MLQEAQGREGESGGRGAGSALGAAHPQPQRLLQACPSGWPCGPVVAASLGFSAEPCRWGRWRVTPSQPAVGQLFSWPLGRGGDTLEAMAVHPPLTGSRSLCPYCPKVLRDLGWTQTPLPPPPALTQGRGGGSPGASGGWGLALPPSPRRPPPAPACSVCPLAADGGSAGP